MGRKAGWYKLLSSQRPRIRRKNTDKLPFKVMATVTYSLNQALSPKSPFSYELVNSFIHSFIKSEVLGSNDWIYQLQNRPQNISLLGRSGTQLSPRESSSFTETSDLSIHFQKEHLPWMSPSCPTYLNTHPNLTSPVTLNGGTMDSVPRGLKAHPSPPCLPTTLPVPQSHELGHEASLEQL